MKPIFPVAIISVLFCVVIGCAPRDSAADAVLIVAGGEPRAEIVIAEEPVRMTRLAAEELQTYIEKISGAVLPIVTAPSGNAARIYVGMSPHTEALGLETEGLKYGAFRMDSGDGWLALLGADQEFEPVEPYPRRTLSRDPIERERVFEEWDAITGDTFWNPMPVGGGGEAFDDRGTLNAVHAFLRDLGVRWYMPGEIGEVVPQITDLSFKQENRIVRPDFPVRNTSWFQGGVQPVREDDIAWQLRLGLHPGHDVVGITQLVHGMKYVFMREEMKEAHPELFARRGEQFLTMGENRPGSPCLSSEGVLEKHVAYLRAMFDHYDEPMVSIDPVDGFAGLICDRPPCSEQITPERGWRGSASEYVWQYLNRVAWEMHKTHPERMVSGIAYSSYRLPPESIEQFAPNLAVILIPGDEFPQSRGMLQDPKIRSGTEEFREKWFEKIPSDQIYTFSNVHFNWMPLGNSRGSPWWGVPIYYPRALAEDLRSLKGRVMGEIIECYEPPRDQTFDWNPQAVAHLALYAYSQLWWDADLDIDAMLDEYYELFYGPARNEMQAFIEYSEKHWPQMLTEAEVIDRALELLTAAQAAVEPDSIYGRRVQLVVDYVQPLHALKEKLSAEREGPELRLPVRPRENLVVDGRLDDAFWDGVPVRPLVGRNGEKPDIATTVRFAWSDNGALVVGIRCDEPDMEGLVDTADGASGIFSGDYVDLLIETPVRHYYQITVSPFGALLDMDRGNQHDTSWSSQATVAAYRGEDYWSVEIHLPAAGDDAREMDPNTGVAGSTPVEDAPWYFNLARFRPRGDEAEITVVAPTGDGRRSFHDRFKFGRLVVTD